MVVAPKCRSWRSVCRNTHTIRRTAQIGRGRKDDDVLDAFEKWLGHFSLHVYLVGTVVCMCGPLCSNI